MDFVKPLIRGICYMSNIKLVHLSSGVLFLKISYLFERGEREMGRRDRGRGRRRPPVEQGASCGVQP